jgi:hypothetical protein
VEALGLAATDEAEGEDEHAQASEEAGQDDLLFGWC